MARVDPSPPTVTGARAHGGARPEERAPRLPRGWRADQGVRAAFGEPQAGDFVCTHVSLDPAVLEVALFDVSGHGHDAATRAGVLSGFVRETLGSVAAQQFLPAVNAHLLGQHWQDGFATAVHLQIDLTSGAYSLGNAGHPPPAHRTDRWRILDSVAGPVLGVLPGAAYGRYAGLLGPGEAMVLYSDGLVETRDNQIDDGIALLLADVDALAEQDPVGVAARLLARASTGEGDDRAVFIISRQ